MSVLVPSLAEAILEYHRVERARREAAAAAFGIHDVPYSLARSNYSTTFAGTCRQAVRTAKTLEDPLMSGAGTLRGGPLATARELAITTAQRAGAAAVEACELIQELARHTTHRPVGEVTHEALLKLDAAIDETLKRSSEGG